MPEDPGWRNSTSVWLTPLDIAPRVGFLRQVGHNEGSGRVFVLGVEAFDDLFHIAHKDAW